MSCIPPQLQSYGCTCITKVAHSTMYYKLASIDLDEVHYFVCKPVNYASKIGLAGNLFHLHRAAP